jgi:hypothetical protein
VLLDEQLGADWGRDVDHHVARSRERTGRWKRDLVE